MTTEQEMRNSVVPTFDSVDDLHDYIEDLHYMEHDYGTAVYAMSMAATAAYNFIANILGVTGFQASCADLDILRRTRNIQTPFALITAEDMLYPQHGLEKRVKELEKQWMPWAKEAARELLADSKNRDAHESVWQHWKKLAE